MALHIGSSEPQKIVLNGVTYSLNLFSATPITNFTKLLSLDNYTLKDSNNTYLTVEEDE